MPTTIPALQGKFGNIEYWLTTMSIGELVRVARLPQELPGWEDMSIEDKYQRDINITRVRKSVAPYFASDEYRFSSALVLTILNDDNIVFEQLPSLGGGSRSNPVPALYQTAAANMGFLTLAGDEVLVPLDGQHRIKAFKFAIDGADDNNRPIAELKANTDLSKDQVAVILVRFQPTPARRIFSKINRYAKPTSKADNLITDDDDAIAVMTRELLGEDGVIPTRLVRIGANTLPKTAPEFTTLATFYESTAVMVNELGYTGKGKASDMDEEQRQTIREEDVQPLWEKLLSGIDLWAKALADPSENGDADRSAIREDTLLGKPIGQLALVSAFMRIREKCVGVGVDEICDRLNRVSWDVSDPTWHGVIMNPNGRVMSGKTTVNRSAQFIAYLCGAELSEEDQENLLEQIHGSSWDEHELPPPVV